MRSESGDGVVALLAVARVGAARAAQRGGEPVGVRTRRVTSGFNAFDHSREVMGDLVALSPTLVAEAAGRARPRLEALRAADNVRGYVDGFPCLRRVQFGDAFERVHNRSAVTSTVATFTPSPTPEP